MPNPDFSNNTRAISDMAAAAAEKVAFENAREFHSIPAQYRADVRFLIRIGFFEGYGAGIDKATAMALEPMRGVS